MKNDSCWFAGMTGVAVFLGLRAVGATTPELVNSFSRVAAWLAATALGVSLEGGVDPIIAHSLFPLQIVRTCSGWSFFCLLAALLVARALASPARWQCHLQLTVLAVPLAAVITLLANAARFVTVVTGGRYVLPHLPPLAGASFHAAIGVAVFLPTLIVAYSLWERRIDNV